MATRHLRCRQSRLSHADDAVAEPSARVACATRLAKAFRATSTRRRLHLATCRQRSTTDTQLDIEGHLHVFRVASDQALVFAQSSVSTVRSSGSAARPKLLTPPAAVITSPPSTSDSNGYTRIAEAFPRYDHSVCTRRGRVPVLSGIFIALIRSLRSAVSVGAGRTSSRAGDGGAGFAGHSRPAPCWLHRRRQERGQP